MWSDGAMPVAGSTIVDDVDGGGQPPNAPTAELKADDTFYLENLFIKVLAMVSPRPLHVLTTSRWTGICLMSPDLPLKGSRPSSATG